MAREWCVIVLGFEQSKLVTLFSKLSLLSEKPSQTLFSKDLLPSQLESIQNTEIGIFRSKFRLLPLFGTFVAEKSSSELSAFAISIFSWPR